ncbi:PP2C family protein-serine/threonine phosphatase [Marinobacterium jannaschii]|uniref:PP2C family protein-serine/threonine phosphatase n=1 Tax=Marinobacterium jannaschii TaxID=64970 RepID=UPI0004877ACB|nr:SpoIIE family protein phosphatase [Marinobacterium jannaschii]
MGHADQAVLLIDRPSQVIDTVFEMLNEAELPAFRVVTRFSLGEALVALEERAYSVVIFRPGAEGVLAAVKDIACRHRCKPLVVLLDEDDSSLLFGALRSGASDLFPVASLHSQSEEFVELVSSALRQAQLLEDNQRYREELEQRLAELKDDQQAALKVQQNMLPPEQQVLAGMTVDYTLLPSLYLSGDFVDAIALDKHRVVFYLADVSGHGASSALVTVLLKNMTGRLLRNFRRGSSYDILSPLQFLKRINKELLEAALGKHLSIFAGIIDLDENRLTYAIGGQHPMPLLQSGEQIDFLKGRGMPVGLFEEPVFDERSIELPESFQLTLFSDGVLEVLPDHGMEAKEASLMSLVHRLQGGSAHDLQRALISGGVSMAPDDIAIMTISR